MNHAIPSPTTHPPLRSRPGLGIAIAVGLLAGSAFAESPVARLDTYAGTVNVLRAGAVLSLHPGLALLNGDTVATREGRAVVVFNDRSEVRVRPNTRIAINDQGERREIDVFFGRLWAFVSKSKDKQTNFKSGGTIAAVRGTILELFAELAPWLKPEDIEDLSKLKIVGLHVGVVNGTVEVLHELPDGSLRTLTLHAGEGVGIDTEHHSFEEGSYQEGDIAGDEGAGDPTPTPTPVPGATPTPTPGGGRQELEQEQFTLGSCFGCQIWDFVARHCVDYDALCSEPCFRGQQCRGGQCAGGQRVVSAEDPNCP